MTVEVDPESYEGDFLPEPCVFSTKMGAELGPEDIANMLISFADACINAAPTARRLGGPGKEFAYRALALTVKNAAERIIDTVKEIDKFNSGVEVRIHGGNN